MARNQECEWVREQINAFLDNELIARDAVTMTHHLETCVPCRHEYERMKAVRHALRTLPAPALTVSEASKSRAFARLEQSIAQPTVTPSLSGFAFWRRLVDGPTLRPMAAALAVAVVGGVTFLLWPEEETPSVPTAGSVAAPTTAEWDNLFHRHDAQTLSFSVDDPALRRDAAAEAHASLLRQADEEVTGSL